MMLAVKGSVGNATKRCLILFVHGIFSSPKCWHELITLLQADPTIEAVYDIIPFEYSSPKINIRLTQRVPSLKEVANRLGALILSDQLHTYQEITLVGHSQGGLIIQHYLIDTLRNGRSDQLRRIRQVVLFATPNLGSVLLSPLRKVISFLPVINTQEKSLRAMNQEIANLRLAMLKYVVAASYRDSHHYPVPVQCFYGTKDRVVLQASAAGHFINVQGIRGDHSSCIRPDNPQDERYLRFKELLINPIGSLHIFEVDKYEVQLQIKPLGEDAEKIVRHGNKQRTVRTDSEALLSRKVFFSRNNKCEDLFDISYSTRFNGFIEPEFSHYNEASLKLRTAYLDYGNTVSFQFRPLGTGPYFLKLKLYKAFDEGNRNIHFHMSQRSFIKKYHCRLDLRSYLEGGYSINVQPHLYFDPHEPPDHLFCDRRVLEHPEPYQSHERVGIWEWELRCVTGGVIDIRWEVKKG